MNACDFAIVQVQASKVAGPIPGAVGSLLSIESKLSMALNQLTGPLPEVLCLSSRRHHRVATLRIILRPPTLGFRAPVRETQIDPCTRKYSKNTKNDPRGPPPKLPEKILKKYKKCIFEEFLVFLSTFQVILGVGLWSHF